MGGGFAGGAGGGTTGGVVVVAGELRRVRSFSNWSSRASERACACALVSRVAETVVSAAWTAASMSAWRVGSRLGEPTCFQAVSSGGEATLEGRPAVAVHLGGIVEASIGRDDGGGNDKSSEREGNVGIQECIK